MPPKPKRAKSLVCEGCGGSGAKYIVLDDRGLQAGVFLFCSQCSPKKKYRTGDYVVRWFRISEDLPPSRKPHRDVNLWEFKRFDDEGYVSPYDLAHKKLRRRCEHIVEEDDDKEEDGQTRRRPLLEKDTKVADSDEEKKNSSSGKSKLNFFAALEEAKAAGPMPAHIKPLKRMAMEVVAKNTLAGNMHGAFESLRLLMHDCLHESFVNQLVETNRLSDYHARLAAEKQAAELEANKGKTLKAVEAAAVEYDVDEDPEAAAAAAAVTSTVEEEELTDPMSVALRQTSARDKWKQFSKHFLSSLNSFAWDSDPQLIDLSSCGMRSRDLDLLCATVTKQTVGCLNLKWNLMGANNSIFLYNIIAANCVHTLHLGWNKLGDDGVLVVSSALHKAKSLRDLDLTGNAITKVGIRHLCKGIGEDTLLRRLNLSFNSFGAEGATELVESGLGTAPLTHVGLRNCELGVHGAVTIARGFRKNRSLKEIGLADNHVTQEGARQVARNLKLGPGALLRAFGVGSGSRSAAHVRSANGEE